MHEKFFQTARTNMVKNQILPNNVQGKELINAFMSIKKELFVPKKFHDLVYSDADIMINEKRALIRTFIMAKMFEKCKFSKNDSILVVGCLTGYSLAILSSLVSYVFGIDNEKNVVDLDFSVKKSPSTITKNGQNERKRNRITKYFYLETPFYNYLQRL